MTKAKQGNLSIHTENIFPIIKKWLYSEHDIFIRELISNATDASNKRKAINPDLNDNDLDIEVKIDKNAKTISIIDNGIGMTAPEIEKYINQIAFSGAEDFIAQFKDKQSNIIGHFGLGFYSAFMVSDKVTIDSLSYQDGAEPAFWECDGSISYSIKKGKRKTIGTTVTLHLNIESDAYLEEHKTKELIEKYCNFMPFPIKLGKDTINQKEALWNKKPNDVTEEEYKEFYKNIFHEYIDPIFWIHLNAEYPFTLKGILYFPKIKQHDIEMMKGKVKLYCHNVFVADNLKEFIPEFMTMLRGGIDVPDIPLNVSRSFLQNDKQVQQIRKYIIKKISDQFISTFKEDREKYCSYWNDVQNVIKYGMLTEEDFGDNMREYVIFKTSNGEYTTIDEYVQRNKKEENMTRIYYGVSENTQVSLLNLIKDQNIEVIFCDSPLDTHLMQQLEMKNQNIRFIRIDSEINDLLIDKEKPEVVDADNKTVNQNIADKIKEILGNEKVTIEVKSLKANNIPGMVIYDEFMRRFSEMSALTMGGNDNFLNTHTFVLNSENKTVKRIYDLSLEGKTDEAKMLATYIHSLAMLEQKRFTGEELKAFVENANKVLELIN